MFSEAHCFCSGVAKVKGSTVAQTKNWMLSIENLTK